MTHQYYGRVLRPVRHGRWYALGAPFHLADGTRAVPLSYCVLLACVSPHSAPSPSFCAWSVCVQLSSCFLVIEEDSIEGTLTRP